MEFLESLGQSALCTGYALAGGTSHLSTNNGIFQCDLRNGISPFDWYIGARQYIAIALIGSGSNHGAGIFMYRLISEVSASNWSFGAIYAPHMQRWVVLVKAVL